MCEGTSGAFLAKRLSRTLSAKCCFLGVGGGGSSASCYDGILVFKMCCWGNDFIGILFHCRGLASVFYLRNQ